MYTQPIKNRIIVRNFQVFYNNCTQISTKFSLDFDCAYFQWHEVPESFNLGDDPNSCIRVDTELRPNGPNHADVPPVPNVPWGTSKYLLASVVEQN